MRRGRNDCQHVAAASLPNSTTLVSSPPPYTLYSHITRSSAIMASDNFAVTQPNGTAGTAPLNGRASHRNGATERLQIVDDEKHFTCAFLRRPTIISNTFFHRPDLTKQIERWGLRDTGFEYNLVAVFGSQSTGKSRLLENLLKRMLAESLSRYSTK
jgi:hypothetical protein